MDNVTKLLLQGAGGGDAADGEYIDDLFSVDTYTGVPGGSATVTSGVDLSGSNEGMVWVKNRYASSLPLVYDTIRGGGNAIYPDRDSSQGSDSDGPQTFTNTGYTTGSAPASSHLSWTFKSAPGFFDVVTYTGNGATGREISHNLEGLPGFMLLKRTDSSGFWMTASIRNDASQYEFCNLNNANYKFSNDLTANVATASVFKVNNGSWGDLYYGGDGMNVNGASYVCYLFANNAAKFGIKGNNSVVKCGQYTGNGSSNGPDVNLGWEPQWLLIKRSNASEDWMAFDHIRTSNRQDMYLDDYRPNNTTGDGDGAGGDSQPYLNWTSTGFKLTSNTTHTNGNNDTYSYVAIRRADGYVGKPVTVGTDVFALDYSNGGSFPNFDANFAVDFWLARNPTSGGDMFTAHGRLTGNNYWRTYDNQPWSHSSLVAHDDSDGVGTSFGSSYMAWMWKRHAGFDVVTYTGNATSGRTISHSLNNIPEMIVCKKANGTGGWQTYHVGAGNTKYLYWNQNYAAQVSGAVWANTTPTKSVFTIGAGAEVNENGYLYQALLFSSVEGVSKVGSYTGNGTLWHEITTGFQPRFLIIKSATQSYGWFVVDTTRGFASGDEKVLLLNTSGAQSSWGVANPISTGFQLNNDGAINANGEEYLYYAHA